MVFNSYLKARASSKSMKQQASTDKSGGGENEAEDEASAGGINRRENVSKKSNGDKRISVAGGHGVAGMAALISWRRHM